MPLFAWSDAYPYRSPLHDPWTGLPLEDAVSGQPITDRDPGDEDQPIAGNVTFSAATMTSGGPSTAIRYGQVASWADYQVACQERDRMAADLAALRPLVRAVEDWNEMRERAYRELARFMINNDDFERRCAAPLDRIWRAHHALPPALLAWALEGE